MIFRPQCLRIFSWLQKVGRLRRERFKKRFLTFLRSIDFDWSANNLCHIISYIILYTISNTSSTLQNAFFFLRLLFPFPYFWTSTRFNENRKQKTSFASTEVTNRSGRGVPCNREHVLGSSGAALSRFRTCSLQSNPPAKRPSHEEPPLYNLPQDRRWPFRTQLRPPSESSM